MFSKNRFKAAFVEIGMSMQDVANELGINKVTLYRKINGESDFFREEILKIKKMLNRENVDDIFFADEVAETQQNNKEGG